MDGTILNKKYKFGEKIDELADDCEDLDERVTALENAPAPSAGINYYVETHTAQSSASFSHTFEHQPLAILQIRQPYTAGGGRPYFTSVPITFDASGNLISTSIVVVNNSDQTAYCDISWNKETKTLTYTGGSWDVAFNRADSEIAYISAEAPTPSTTRKKSKK